MVIFSIASIVPNLNNPKEYLLIMAKDFVEGYTYQDYYASGFRLVKRYWCKANCLCALPNKLSLMLLLKVKFCIKPSFMYNLYIYNCYQYIYSRIKYPNRWILWASNPIQQFTEIINCCDILYRCSISNYSYVSVL